MIGKTISHYRIIEKVGEGAMGVVYRAHDTHLERDVALKALPEGALTDGGARKRLRKEALALSRFSHPNIETVFDFDSEQGVDFLVVEYLPGQTLRSRLRACGSLPIREVVSLAQQLAEGLAAAHDQSVVHRDLKPSNLWVTTDGRLKILDFGLAKHLRSVGHTSTAPTLSLSDHIAGTPLYMAPEQLRGDEVDLRADVFGMGGVLYEMATGRRAFGGETVPQVTDAILHQDPVPPRALNPQVPPDLERIALKCLAKDPEERYQSAAEVAVDLRRTQGGDKSAEAVTKSSRSRTRGKVAVYFVTAALLALASFAVWQRTRPASTLPSEKLMLAVLPFENLSSNSDQEYFSDGITEEMISQLGQLQPDRLGVIARTSVMRFKESRSSIRAIGQDLGVDFILEGSVRREADRVRVTAQLIQVSDETHLWANSYDDELREILTLQSDIARAVAGEIQLTLTAKTETQLRNPRAVDKAAFEAYLKGRYWWSRRSQDAMRRGVEYFEEAIALDPSYAPAHAGLANSYLMLGSYDALSPHDAFPRARAAAERALEIDPGLAEAHACLAYVSFLYAWDWNAAERGYRDALTLNPNYAMGHAWYAVFLSSMGRMDEAMEEMDRASALDPLSLIIGALRGWVLYFAAAYDLALEQCMEITELDPSFYPAHMFAARAYLRVGECEKALAAAREAIRLSGNEPAMMPELAYSLAACGQKDEAREILNDLLSERGDSHFQAINIALVQTGLENYDEALRWLERAVEQRYPWVVQIRVDPWWEPLKQDPRFQELERRIGLREAES